MIAGVWWGWQKLPPPPLLPPITDPHCSSLPASLCQHPRLMSQHSCKWDPLNLHLGCSDRNPRRVRSLGWRTVQLGGWGVPVLASPMLLSPRQCLLQHRNCFFLCVSKNLISGRQLSRHHPIQCFSACGLWATSGLSDVKGAAKGLQTMSWDRHMHPHTCHKGEKTTGSGCRRQIEDNVLQLTPPWGGPKVFIALSKKERKNQPD